MPNAFLDRYKTDKTAEAEGAWVALDEGLRVKIVRANHPEARKMRRRLEKPYQAMREVPEAAQEKITTQIIARVILKDWEGVTDEKGKAIPFSPDAAEKVFEQFPDFRDEVIALSLQRDTFKAEVVEEAAKN